MADKTWKATNATNLPKGGRTDDIWFLDEVTGWAVNSTGEILATRDGGQSWQKQHQFPPRTWLRCVSFADQQNGWVGTTTSSDRLYSTDDGGTTWKNVNTVPAEPTAICGLCAVNQNVIYAAGTNWPNRPAAVIRSTDGGSSWTRFDMNAQASLLVDIYFKDEEIGWVVGGAGGSTRDEVKPVVLHTTDGGETWANQLQGMDSEFPKGEWGWKIQFLDENVGFVSLENFEDAAILKTSNGGRAWERVSVKDQQGNVNLEGVGFISPDKGWVGGWGGFPLPGPGFSSATEDGGASWQDANEIGLYINRFRFLGSPPTVGYASGSTVYKYAEHTEKEIAAFGALDGNGDKSASLNSEDLVVCKGTLQIELALEAGLKNLELNIWDSFSEHKRRTILAEDLESGAHKFEIPLEDDDGEPLSRGQYIYRVSSDNFADSRLFIVDTNAPVAQGSGIERRRDKTSSLPMPTVDQEKEAFHKLANSEDYPEFLTIAKDYAYAYLSNADYSALELYNEFEYSEAAFDERMAQIYEAALPGMYQPYSYDREVIQWSNGKSYRVGRASNSVVKDQLLQLSPFNLMDGVWLQKIMQARPSDEVQSRLFDIWADEVGNGENRENHSNVYLDLLRSQGMYVPPVTSSEFLDLDLAPGAWRAPVFQMTIGAFPEEFFPELIGMTLLLEWEATPTLQPKVQMLKGRGINPLFYALHVAIDNISEGHGAISKEAVKIFLAEKREEGGERAVQENWKRIWNGYVGWATAGFNGAGLAERRLLIDRKSINLGTPEDPVCFPDYKKYYEDKMIAMIAEKAPYASKVHGRSSLGGALLNDLFGDPKRLMQTLLDEGLLNKEKPRRSPFFKLLEFEGPMYRVFTKEDESVILDWLESLNGDHVECIEPEPEPGEPGDWAGKMVKLISDFSFMAKRAHDRLKLPDDTGAAVDLLDLFDEPEKLMLALVRGGWVVPSAPDRSMFYTRIMSNGGPMSGELGKDGEEIVYNWILGGAKLPSVDAATPQTSVMHGLVPDEKSKIRTVHAALEEFRLKRQFVGQGSVH